VDEMNEQLTEIIAFLGKRGAGVRLQAIELQRYAEGATEILVPQLHGEFFRVPAADGKRVAWDSESFFAEANRKLRGGQLTALSSLYKFSLEQTDWQSWGKGATYGSFSVHIDRISKRALYTATTNGYFVANFGHLNDSQAALKFRDNLGQGLKKLQGLKIPTDYQKLWLSIPPENWTPVANEIVEALRGLLQPET
jgi:hypothetical protein